MIGSARLRKVPEKGLSVKYLAFHSGHSQNARSGTHCIGGIPGFRSSQTEPHLNYQFSYPSHIDQLVALFTPVSSDRRPWG